MSKISDLYYQIITEKINGILDAIRSGQEPETEMQFSNEEIGRIYKILIDKNLKNGTHFIFDREEYDSYYGEPNYLVVSDTNGLIMFHGSRGTLIGEDLEFNLSEEENEKLSKLEKIVIQDLLARKKITDEKMQIETQTIQHEDSIEIAKNKAIDARENLVRAKLRETIKDMMVGKEQSRNNGLNRDNEIYVLLDMLKKAGFEEEKDFYFEEQPFEYNDTVPELHIRIGNDILHFSGMSSTTGIIPMQELEEDVKEEPEYYNARLLKLKPIELEKLGLSIDSIQELSKAKTTNDIRQKFEESLLRDDVVEYYLSKTPEELEAELGIEVSRMVGFEQKNMHHCYDLYGHTLHTVEAVDTTGLTEEQAKKLKVAAFFHDIGKPDVTGFNPKTEQQTFYNHAVHSVDIAKPILERLGYSESEIKQICFFIGHHDDFINYKPSLDFKQKGHAFFREINPSTVSEIITQNKYDFDKLGFESYLPTHTESEETNKKNNAINNENKLKLDIYALL